MAIFDAEYQRVVAGKNSEEGDCLECVAGDAGGRTYCGISEKYNPTWPGWAFVDLGHFSDPMLSALVRSFYLANYWLVCRCDLLPDPLAGAMFSAAINCGASTAIQWLQRALNLELDDSLPINGIMDAPTLAAIEKANSAMLGAAFLGYWLRHYIDLAEAEPSQRKFFTGWVHRASGHFAA